MIQKPLSCKIKKSDVQFDYENVIIKYTDGYESEIKKMISIIYDEIGDIWDEMWTWDDVVDRFEKGHFLWLVFDEGSPVACSWFEKKSKKDLYIYRVKTGTKRTKKIKLKKVIKGLNESMVGWSQTFFLSEKEARKHIEKCKKK